MLDLQIHRITFSNGELSYDITGNDANQVEKIILSDDKNAKELSSMKDAVNTDVSILVQLKDGSRITPDIATAEYESLDSTYFDPVGNIHYFLRRGEKEQPVIGAWKTGSSRVKKGGYLLDTVLIEQNTLKFYAWKKSLQTAKAAELVLWSKKLKETIVFPLDREQFAKGSFSMDISECKERIAVGSVRWDIMVRFRDENNDLVFLRFEDKSNAKRIRRTNPFQFRFPKKENYHKEQTYRFLDAIPVNTEVELGDSAERMLICPNYTLDMQLSLQGIMNSRYYMRSFTEDLVDLQMTEEKITVTIRCKNRGFNIKGLGIVLREDLSVRHHFHLISQVEEKKSLLQTYECSIDEIPWYSISYNFVVEEEKNGIVYDIRPKNISYHFRRRFYDVKWKNSVALDDYLLLLVAMKNGNVLIRYRERLPYDDVLYRKREKKARLLYLLGKPILDHMGIILLFERFSTAAQDNGVHMFEYYMEQKRKNVFYVIRPDMPDYHKVEQYGKQVLPFMSLKHMVYIQAAKVLVSTDTKRHGYQWLGPNSRVYNKLLKKPVVFLQHGVLAMKKVSDIYDRYRANAADLFITSSELEKKFVNQSFRYEPSRIAVTGLARWDVLFDKSKEQKEKEILFIPTWRGWMDGILKEEFLESEYYHVYKHLLESNRLHEMLEKHNMHMIFCMHHKFREFAGEFPAVSERVKLFDFGDTPINELIMRSSFLVTDYSSVAWDSYYLEKPCVFYQFDYDKYMELQGSYFDMETELFGVRVTEEEALLDEMERCMDSGFEEKEEFARLREEYLPYRDRKHRARIDQAIKAMKFHGKTEVL